jgi:pimeloyl-ACP methyl ester carboxylesterase
MARARKTPARRALRSTPRDLSAGVVVVLSGGGVDAMNPAEVRSRMDQYIDAVNADPFVQANTAGQGLRFKLLPNQRTKHLHQAKWRQICDALRLLAATPLIVVGHSNGGAAAMNLARCLQSQGTSVDLLFSCDSVLTLDDTGDINQVPANVLTNVNSYVIPTPAWLLAPFPIGRRNRRQVDGSLDAVLNIGLKYNLPGALAHRNAFYQLAGGDAKRGGGFKLPHLLLDSTLAVLRGETNYDVFHAAEASLQVLATRSRLDIELETTNFRKTLRR